jgi:hypothetical protein
MFVRVNNEKKKGLKIVFYLVLSKDLLLFMLLSFAFYFVLFNRISLATIIQ